MSNRNDCKQVSRQTLSSVLPESTTGGRWGQIKEWKDIDDES